MTAGLNAPQREAVEHRGGPLLVLAGAGSGKTRVITHRIASLLDEGVAPASVLAVTFTNKAALEVRERVAGLVGGAAAAGVAVSTFHSACARILRRHARRIGLTPSFSIYDDDDQASVLRDVLETLDLPRDAEAMRSRSAAIERAKNAALTVAEVHEEARGPEGELSAAVFEAYQAALLRSNACDFGDLVSHVVHLLRADGDVRDAVRAGSEHLLIDEFQDTNRAQFELVRALAGDDVVAVGDDDQAIYGWRGATVENVRRFVDELPGCRVIALEQNYRSSPVILDAAHAVVAQLPARMPKRLTTDRVDSTPIEAFVGRDDREEADFVARRIQRLRSERGLTFGDVAVFFRTNAQSRSFEEAFRRAGIPHAMVGGVAWFDRRELKDVLAYTRVASNRSDEAAFRRIANVPTRGIGKATLRRVIDTREAAGGTFAEAARWVARDATARSRPGLTRLAEVLDELDVLAGRANASELVEHVLTVTDYERYLRDSDPVTADERLQNVEELRASVREFVAAGGDVSISSYLEQVALAGRTAEEPSDDASRVQMMTVHAAKGLEFPAVFVTGLEEAQFPLARQGSVADPDEERRLCYVAYTRARDVLVVSAAMRRRLYAQTRDCAPSCFLLELPAALVSISPESASRSLDWRAARAAAQRAPRERPFAFDEYDQRPWSERVPAQGLVFGDGPVARPTTSASPLVGRTARHRLFGDGRVTGVEVHGDKTRLSIVFPEVGEKTVLRPYVEIVD
ncbi:MAG: UvrD-helicase domain-containing protein [Myxococcales bacterium]|nr:UvrD-helicase domain-containing protein [Myxococcales bacterium]MCB9521579.1 UvrD-helicase domain-containing protein [Myxococcales bacterium]MCB9530575.1 UvrD-helicase domain-containing protein [Myxococcales bacterium]MCB9534476.1 UvrD-helicase domain-containing protein [Myxococcales bacterium]